MGEDLVTTLSMENGGGGGHHGPCTLLSMDPSGHLDDRAVGVMVQPRIGAGARARVVSLSVCHGWLMSASGRRSTTARSC